MLFEPGSLWYRHLTELYIYTYIYILELTQLDAEVADLPSLMNNADDVITFSKLL